MTTIDNRFVQIPLWVLESGVSGGAVKTYAWLYKYANWSGPRTATPSRSTLAKDVGVKSVRSIDGYLRELVEAGAIRVRRRRDPESGDWTSSEYHVITAHPVGGAEYCATPCNDVQEGGAENCATLVQETAHNLEPLTKNQNTPPTSGGECAAEAVSEDELLLVEDAPAPAKADPMDGFDDFWEAYPRRLGKKDARAAWVKARKAHPHLDLPALARAWVEMRKRDEAATKARPWEVAVGFLPYPASWLNGERWEELGLDATGTPAVAAGPDTLTEAEVTAALGPADFHPADHLTAEERDLFGDDYRDAVRRAREAWTRDRRRRAWDRLQQRGTPLDRAS